VKTKIYCRLLTCRTVVLLLSVYFISSAVYAETNQNTFLTTLINEALSSNSEIIYAKNAFESANARIRQASSLNDLELGFEYDRITADRMLTGEPMNILSVSQNIPFPTKLYLRAKIASKFAKMAYENYKLKKLEIISRVKITYSELVFIYKSIELNKENKTILDNLSKTATMRYATAKGSQTDALKAQVELAKADNELIILEQKRLTTQSKLNILLNKNPTNDIGVPSDEPPIKFNHTLDEFISMAKADNPELKVYQYAVERGQSSYKLSYNEYLPDFSVKFKQMLSNGSLESDEWSGMIGVTVPLWFFTKQAFGVKEMQSELEMLKAEYTGKENSILFEINDAYARASANKKLIQLYETTFIPQAKEAVNVSIKAYASNKSDFLTVLDSQRMLINFKLEYLNVILQFRTALADIERLVGSEINF